MLNGYWNLAAAAAAVAVLSVAARSLKSCLSSSKLFSRFFFLFFFFLFFFLSSLRRKSVKTKYLGANFPKWKSLLRSTLRATSEGLRGEEMLSLPLSLKSKNQCCGKALVFDFFASTASD